MMEKPKIMIVDDSLTVRMDLKEAFESSEMETILCSTLESARKYLLNSTCHLIILDVLLPDGDGVDFLKELKSGPLTSHIPIIFLSSEMEISHRIRGLSTGACEYVSKPYSINFLIGRTRELVKEHFPAEGGKKEGKFRLLIIDDALTIREELKETFLKEGYSVYLAKTGEEGLQISLEKRPHAIVVDLHLPGIDGTKVIARIRSDSLLRHTPCILLTATGTKADEFLALESGADTFIRKDEDLEVIVAKVATLLKGVNPLMEEGKEKTLLRPKRILAVDDGITFLNALADTLREDGYDVITCQSGEEALQLLKIQVVDCVLLDLMMPGLSGQETCKKIKASFNLREIPLLMLTAREDRKSMLEGLNAGADDFLPKSSEFEVLKARLRALLRRKHFEEENRRIRNELLIKEIEAASAQANKELAETRAQLLQKLEVSHNELDAFSYTISHDLRAPIRSIMGHANITLQDFAETLSDGVKDHLKKIILSSQKMGKMIDGLLDLAHIGRQQLAEKNVNLTLLSQNIMEELLATSPTRNTQFTIQEGITVKGDERLLMVLMQNLLNNAWKFTGKREKAVIEFGLQEREENNVYFVRDNGDGFDMKYSEKLFGAFQRLHTVQEFEGTGIGLATVNKIIQRHQGKIWAESRPGEGAVFFFTLGVKGGSIGPHGQS